MNLNKIRGFWRIKKLIKKFIVLFLSFPKNINCNICNWSGRRFIDDDWHEGIICPVCNSDVRHRLLYYSMNELISEPRKKVIHFAPEFNLKNILNSKFEYTSADIESDKQIDLSIDISDMYQIDDETFDILIASDVLEHVYNDQKALNEIYRVLKKDGCAILTVPQPDKLDKTNEDLSEISKSERIKKFGQADHLRIYGSDFKEFLEKANFSVKIFDENSAGSAKKNKYVLAPPVKSLDPLATNHRKVYHAYKN